MPTRLCAEPGCPDPVAYRGRCQRHARNRERQTHPNKSVYNTKRWQILRRKVLHDQPLCYCGEIATDVHHIRDIQDGGPIWAMGNLQALCHSHHSQITRKEQQ